jgi:uncharacterized cupredoxin-like copper-binding protein
VNKNRFYLVIPLVLAACSGSSAPVDLAHQAAAPSVNWAGAGSVTVHMSDFTFAPSHLALRAGTPSRLLLVNDSGSEHRFAASALFAVSTFGPGSAPATGDGVTVPAHGSAEVQIVPAKPGSYPFECSEPLHSIMGMSGSIDVAG